MNIKNLEKRLDAIRKRKVSPGIFFCNCERCEVKGRDPKGYGHCKVDCHIPEVIPDNSLVFIDDIQE